MFASYFPLLLLSSMCYIYIHCYLGQRYRHQQISTSSDFLTAVVSVDDEFGVSVANLPDLDGDSIDDLVVGMYKADGGKGAAMILFLNSSGHSKSHQVISATKGFFTGSLSTVSQWGNFGTGSTSLGDIDGDQLSDIAVGAYCQDSYMGALYIIFLAADGTCMSHQKIASRSGGFTASLPGSSTFGFSVSNAGDLNGDGVSDAITGAQMADIGEYRSGSVYILMLDSNGLCLSHVPINSQDGYFTGVLAEQARFGQSCTMLGLVDGVHESVVVGAPHYSNEAYRDGSIFVIFLNSNLQAVSHHKISAISEDFTAVLGEEAYFGRSSANMGDIDGDGVTDVAVGMLLDAGAVFMMFMNSAGQCRSHLKISPMSAPFTFEVVAGGRFGTGVANIGDRDRNGFTDMAIGAQIDGSVFILFDVDGNHPP